MTWWAEVYGDPCRECGVTWTVPFEEAVADVAAAPPLFAADLPRAGAPVQGWTGTEYVVHVADTLRSWSERLAAAVGGDEEVPGGHDADDLAAVRRYSSFGPSAALWTLRRATPDWCEIVTAAHAGGFVVRHRSRGALSAHDIALRNRHGVLHHLWDVRRLTPEVGG